jgi:hypothetical protein
MAEGLFISVEDLEFRRKLQRFQELTGKSLGDVLREQAKLLAERLMRLTYPKSASQGKKRVAIDIGRVYLQNEWFENIFQFTNQSLQTRITNLVRGRQQADLEAIFRNSPKLVRIHIEPFDPGKHKAARRGGRVNLPAPFSFPLQSQSKVRKYVSQEKKNVGLAKSGWGSCFQQLGGSPPSWLARPAGFVDDRSDSPDNPYITLTNKISYFEAIDSKGNIVSRALAGRGQSMIAAAERALDRAAKGAGFAET